MHVIETDAIKRRYSNFANWILYIILYILFLTLSISLLLKSHYIRKRTDYKNFFFNQIFMYFYTKSIICNMQYVVEFYQKFILRNSILNSIFIRIIF